MPTPFLPSIQPSGSLRRPKSSCSAKTDLWIKTHNHPQIVDKV
jgi:hypothetical protein